MKYEVLIPENSSRFQVSNSRPDLTDFLSQGNFEIIFQSGADARIISLNQVFLANFGEQEHLNAIFETSTDYQQILQTLDSGQRLRDITVRLKHHSGNTIVGRLNVRHDSDTNGKDIFTWVILDITEQSEYKRLLDQKEDDLIKLKAQMEQFLYKASHDLRAPLTTVLGLINLMRFERPNDEILSYAGKIENTINRLDNVIKDIMRFSQNSYTQVHSEKVFFEAMVCRIIKSFNNLPNYKLIHFDIEANETGVFYCDLQRLEIILTNLIRNAIMFADVNKTRPFVTVKMSVVENETTIAIIDNGIGIGKSHLNQVFNMFYRASDRVQGAGLGLYVAKEAVARLNGKIEVQSEIGFGSIFLVTIPNALKGKLVAKKLRLENK